MTRLVRTRAWITIAAINLLVAGITVPAVAAPAEVEARQPTSDLGLTTGSVDLRPITGGLTAPTMVTNAGDGSGRLFVTERAGRIRIISNGVLQSGAFLDIQNEVSAGGERGLLGLAFHLDFEANHKLYVYFTRASDGDIVVREYLTDMSRTAVNEATARNVLVIDHSQFDNHNGGMLAFGPDRYLYIGTGDGGSGGDPFESGQDIESLLGKVLRIDVDSHPGGAAYASPAGNPFVGSAGRDEIWDWGLRNPWRFTFDRANGDLWIADVGQNAWEEVNREAAATGGRNYGWDCREGTHGFESTGCDTSVPFPYTEPVAEYSHSLGCSVTGGYVYRGSVEPDLIGQYVLADYCSGRLWTISADGSVLVFHRQVGANISSFGESETGELYALDLTGGRLLKVIAPPFSDIATSYFYDDIVWLADSGITSGCGGTRFCPTSNVTRAQMASFLVRALDLPGSSTDSFTDDSSSIHESNINALAAAGITSGCTATTFCPNSNVTRGQMASFLSRGFDLTPTAIDYFTDDESSIHEVDINRVARQGITSGCTATTYCPANPVTRGQMAAFLHRALD